MTVNSLVKKRSKAHQRYQTSTGEPCVGVTTVLGMKAKPQLVSWANKLGLEGIDSNKYVDSMARIGTLIHYFIECDVKKTKADLLDYTANEIEIAKKAFFKWRKWRDENDFKLLGSELQLASDSLFFGGTLDIYCDLNGKKTVLDIKTSKACYAEHRTQTVAYKHLLVENKFEVDDCRIIRIGRDETEGFEDILVSGHEVHWRLFKALLDAYWADKAIKDSGA